MVLSKTNTDSLCVDIESDGLLQRNTRWIRKAYYKYNLWTGLYMLEPHERWGLNLLFTILTTMGCLYTFMFWKGLLDGWAGTPSPL
jgi:hypothetical protein